MAANIFVEAPFGGGRGVSSLMKALGGLKARWSWRGWLLAYILFCYLLMCVCVCSRNYSGILFLHQIYLELSRWIQM